MGETNQRDALVFAVDLFPLDTFEAQQISNWVEGTFMLNQPRNPRGFGVDDKLRCRNCGELTSLTRPAPAAEDALEYERQTFTCPACEQEFERVVDARGKAVRFLALSRQTDQVGDPLPSHFCSSRS